VSSGRVSFRGEDLRRDRKSEVRYRRGGKVCGKWEGFGPGAIYEQTDTFENGRRSNVIERERKRLSAKTQIEYNGHASTGGL
jgi:hypothetical protein